MLVLTACICILDTSELTQTRAIVHSFVKEVEVKPGKAAIVYSMPAPEDNPPGGANSAEVALNVPILSLHVYLNAGI